MTPEEWQAVGLSLSVALRSVALALPVGILLAWILSRRRFWGRPLLDAIVHLPLVVPPVVVGWGLLMLFGLRGPFGSWLDAWFGVRLVFSLEGAALATAVMSLPLVVRSVRLSLEAVDQGLEQAAATLGARRLDRFFTITLPLMAPGVLAGGITAFAAGLGEFGAVITFAGNVPGETQTLPLAIYAALQTPGGEAMAARMAGLSFALALSGLLLAETMHRALSRAIGRG